MDKIINFEPFQKIARLRRDIVITEKLDGTNAQLVIEDVLENQYIPMAGVYSDNGFGPEGHVRVMRAGSRSRYLTRETDNFGFCNWAMDNANALIQLGPGRHYGEWWGKGIQRGYGLDGKRFSLFNAARWNADNLPACVSVVPTLYVGTMNDLSITSALEQLRFTGSKAAPGFMHPEGIVIYHAALRELFKITLDNDALPKGVAA